MVGEVMSARPNYVIPHGLTARIEPALVMLQHSKLECAFQVHAPDGLIYIEFRRDETILASHYWETVETISHDDALELVRKWEAWEGQS